MDYKGGEKKNEKKKMKIETMWVVSLHESLEPKLCVGMFPRSFVVKGKQKNNVIFISLRVNNIKMDLL